MGSDGSSKERIPWSGKIPREIKLSDACHQSSRYPRLILVG